MIVILVLAPMVFGGGVVGAALAGFVNIPGLTPKKGSAAGLYGETAAALSGEGTGQGPVTEAPTPARVSTPPATPVRRPASEPEDRRDPAQGAKKVAQLWNNLELKRLKELAAQYTDPELALIVLNMDPERAAELLGGLEAEKAARLSKELGRQASVVPAEP